MEERGTGFVHLNTPASIKYTEGKILSISELKRPKTRVETVTVPHYMFLWRKAFAQYTQIENYTSFADDIENERSGNGPILPPIAPVSKTSTQPFFTPYVCTNTNMPTAEGTASHGISEMENKQICLEVSSNSAAASTSMAKNTISSVKGSSAIDNGISIISHHKVAGVNEFIYPDYDGVLSSGVIPQVVITAEEQAELDADKQYYITPLEMTNEELNAFEELQAVWRSKARSHSFAGAQHRAAGATVIINAEGEVAPIANKHVSATSENNKNEGTHANKRVRHESMSNDNNRSYNYVEDEQPEEELIEENSDQLLEEALRMADDLLRYAETKWAKNASQKQHNLY